MELATIWSDAPFRFFGERISGSAAVGKRAGNSCSDARRKDEGNYGRATPEEKDWFASARSRRLDFCGELSLELTESRRDTIGAA